jgi:hypothetical protein
VIFRDSQQMPLPDVMPPKIGSECSIENKLLKQALGPFKGSAKLNCGHGIFNSTCGFDCKHIKIKFQIS